VIRADLLKTRRDENQEFTAQESGQVVSTCQILAVKERKVEIGYIDASNQFKERLISEPGGSKFF
jgi:hypothetical protein